MKFFNSIISLFDQSIQWWRLATLSMEWRCVCFSVNRIWKLPTNTHVETFLFERKKGRHHQFVDRLVIRSEFSKKASFHAAQMSLFITDLTLLIARGMCVWEIFFTSALMRSCYTITWREFIRNNNLVCLGAGINMKDTHTLRKETRKLVSEFLYPSFCFPFLCLSFYSYLNVFFVGTRSRLPISSAFFLLFFVLVAWRKCQFFSFWPVDSTALAPVQVLLAAYVWFEMYGRTCFRLLPSLSSICVRVIVVDFRLFL